MPFRVNVVLVTQFAYTTVADKARTMATIIFFISNSVREKEKSNNNSRRKNPSSIAFAFKRPAKHCLLKPDGFFVMGNTFG